MSDSTERLAAMIRGARHIVFFGGAGVSTESGIPDFRSAHGIYSGAQGRSYEEMLSIRYFYTHLDEFWRFYRAVMLYPDAQPNAAHRALARLERQGKLAAILTQNIDGLHQAAGSKRVWELHGTVHSNSCTRCGKRYTLGQALEQAGTPRCSCGGALRPDIIMYGEPLDEGVLEGAIAALQASDLVIVGGTSLVVQPAAGLIRCRRAGVPLALINRDETPYDDEATLVIRENIADVLDKAIPAEGEDGL